MSTSKLGVSTHVSKKFLDETVRLRSRINFLKTQNEGYDESQKLANETKDAKTRMEDARKSQLDTVQTINQSGNGSDGRFYIRRETVCS